MKTLFSIVTPLSRLLHTDDGGALTDEVVEDEVVRGQILRLSSIMHAAGVTCVQLAFC